MLKRRYFSYKVLEMKPSVIRELIKKYPGKGDIITFTGGRPHPDTFPVDVIKELVIEALEKYRDVVLQYGATQGYSGLIESIKDFIRRRYGIASSNIDVLITTGSAQALDLAGSVFLNSRDVVVVEAPTYTNAIDAFAQYDPNFLQIPLDSEGMMVNVLEDILKKLKVEGKTVKLVYTMPTFHNPTGVNMSESRRKYLLELASTYDFLILEDDAYRELNYFGESPPPPIKYWDSEGRVIYCGSFSKVLAPGFRVGWVVADPEIIREFEIVKQRRDLHTSTLCQYVAAEYVRRGYLEQHVEKIRNFYRPRLKAMLDALEDFMPEGFEWTKPSGGMFVWVSGPRTLNTTLMLDNAVRNGVVYVPSEAFYVDRSVKNAMRLNFSYPNEEEIVEGVRRLAKTCKEELTTSSP
jgi:2-aminoadipate transaminase